MRCEEAAKPPPILDLACGREKFQILDLGRYVIEAVAFGKDHELTAYLSINEKRRLLAGYSESILCYLTS